MALRPNAAERLQVAFDLYQAAEEMMRLKLRRRFPEQDEAAIEEGIREWLQRRPGAEIADGVGRPTSRPGLRK